MTGGSLPLRGYFPYRAVRTARRDKGNTPLPPLRGTPATPHVEMPHMRALLQTLPKRLGTGH